MGRIQFESYDDGNWHHWATAPKNGSNIVVFNRLGFIETIHWDEKYGWKDSDDISGHIIFSHWRDVDCTLL